MSPLPDARTDHELVDAINAGDADAFDALYRRHRDWAVRLAYRFTGDRDLALDVMQEAFVYLIGKFPGFTLTCRFTTFFYPVIRHIAIRHRQSARRAQADQSLSKSTDIATAESPPSDDREAIVALLAQLDEAHREVLMLRFVDAMSLDEIAAAMQIPLGTVKSRLHHALAKLRADPRTKIFFVD